MLAKFAGGYCGSGRVQHRGATGEIQGGVQLPQPRARINLPLILIVFNLYNLSASIKKW
jgi:hypothetical protein